MVLCRTLAICIPLLALQAGCTSTSGLLFRPGPHKVLNTAERTSESPVPSWGISRELAEQVLPEYRVEPGDVLAVEPEDFNASIRLPADQEVQPDGMIDLGKYGRLQVVGLTVDEIQTKIKQRIHEREQKDVGPADPSDDDGSTGVFVRLVEPQSKVYYVVGEVNSPGAYPLIGRESVLDALFAAGGLTDRADRQRILLSRPTSPGSCRTVLPVCYRHIVQLGDTFTNYQIQPGDRIYVASLTFWREVGQALFPYQGEKCPKSACYQVSCEQDTLDMDLINTVTDAEPSPTSTRIR